MQGKILSLTLASAATRHQKLPLTRTYCSCCPAFGCCSAAYQKVEIVLHIVLRVCESVMRFFNPALHFTNVTEQFEKMPDSGIIAGVLQKLPEFGAADDTRNITLRIDRAAHQFDASRALLAVRSLSSSPAKENLQSLATFSPS